MKTFLFRLLFQKFRQTAACLQTINPVALRGELLLILSHDIALKVRVMQIERDILNQPSKLADLLQTPLEKALIIRLKAQITLLTQDFIVYFQIRTPGQAALALTIRRPRIGKIQVNAVYLTGREHLAQLSRVEGYKPQIGQRLLLAALSCHDERPFLALDRDKIHIRVLLGHADGKTALAAADLQMDRIVVAEQGAPLAAFFLRLKRHNVRAGGKSNVQVFLFAHSHA